MLYVFAFVLMLSGYAYGVRVGVKAGTTLGVEHGRKLSDSEWARQLENGMI